MKGFLDKGTNVHTKDGLHCVFLEPLYYGSRNGILYCAPQGLNTDGLSAPHPVWSLVGPVGKGVKGAWCHDADYHGILLKWSGVRWIGAGLLKSEQDTLLYESLQDDGASFKFSLTAYEAVRYGGYPSFEQDLAAPMEKIVLPPTPDASLLAELNY